MTFAKARRGTLSLFLATSLVLSGCSGTGDYENDSADSAVLMMEVTAAALLLGWLATSYAVE